MKTRTVEKRLRVRTRRPAPRTRSAVRQEPVGFLLRPVTLARLPVHVAHNAAHDVRSAQYVFQPCSTLRSPPSGGRIAAPASGGRRGRAAHT
eukprot:923234-Pleurochrysis_carterae.AAC.2